MMYVCLRAQAIFKVNHIVESNGVQNVLFDGVAYMPTILVGNYTSQSFNWIQKPN